ncbi:replication factor C subunit 3-like isoform X2 [Primulina eburnea]|uniref:replication factor C subunit 3-like isoform X2 n=1 Tax=Primulina eburnea TaxID=1245227 RepID=UPI003C6C3B69
MPSPLMPRPKSAPDINTQSSPSHSYVPPPGKSFVSSSLAGGSLLTSGTKKPIRNALEEARISTSSPYYKGLTDFSLVINRERLSGSSPGREIHATSSAGSGYRSSFAVKVQEWGFNWFSLKKHEKNSNEIAAAPENVEDRAPFAPLRTYNQIMNKSTKTGLEHERKKVAFPSVLGVETANLSTKEKPLREKESEGSPQEDVHCPLPQITQPTAQAQPSLLSIPLSCTGTSPPVRSAFESSPSLLPRHPAAVGVTYKNKETTKMTENERKYVWADKYRPILLPDFICNRTTALRLQSRVRNWHNKADECGHFIFEGSPGVGKRTMIWALLREAFGPDKVQVRQNCHPFDKIKQLNFTMKKLEPRCLYHPQAREESKEFHLKGEAVSSVLVNWMVSTQHIEVNISELKGYEKHILVELIKEENEMLSNKTLQCTQENCKAIILYETDKLSTDALIYIKWILGKFKGCNKVFFCCRDMSKLLPLKPLCTVVQLLEPSNEEIVKVLMFIATQEGIELPQQLANKIANMSKNNLRQAIRSFEATWHFNSNLEEDQDIQTGWEHKIANLATNVIQEQSPKQLYNIRGDLQNLIEHNVAPDCICEALIKELKRNIPEQLQPQFDKLSDEHRKNYDGIIYLASSQSQHEEHGKRQNVSRNNVQHFMMIEEFIARIMSWYKGVVTNKEGDQMAHR